MATAISVANFQAACGEVYDAIEAANWSEAWTWYAKAEAQNAGLELSIGESGAQLVRRAALNGLQAAVKAAESSVSRRSNTSRFITTTTAHTGTPQRRRRRAV